MVVQDLPEKTSHKLRELGLSPTAEDLEAVSRFHERFAAQLRLLYEAPVDEEEPAHLVVPRGV